MEQFNFKKEKSYTELMEELETLKQRKQEFEEMSMQAESDEPNIQYEIENAKASIQDIEKEIERRSKLN